jgi:hypothetical protein
MQYSTQLGNEGEMVVGDHLRANVEDLLYEHRVNLVLVRSGEALGVARWYFPINIVTLRLLSL